MNSVIAIMLLVSCSDGFNQCDVADDMLTAYPSAAACEASLVSSVNTISDRGQQLFGKCITTNTDLIESDAAIYWNVTKKGEFYVHIEDEDSANPKNQLSVELKKLVRPTA